MSEQLLDVLKAQRRRRRTGFWLGFFVIFALGGLWAQLSRDPIGPDFGDDFVNDVQADLVEEVPAIEVPVTTEALPGEAELTTTDLSATTALSPTGPTFTGPTFTGVAPTAPPSTEPPSTEPPTTVSP